MYLIGMGLFIASMLLFLLGLKPPRMTSSFLPNLRLWQRLVCVAIATLLMILISYLPVLFDAITDAVSARFQ